MVAGFLIGLTQKAIQVDAGMKALFEEFAVETSPGQFALSPATTKAVRDGFARIWKNAGLKISPVKTTIIALLWDGPKELEQLFQGIQEEEPVSQRAFTNAIKEMLSADLVTMNERRWKRG